MASKMTYLSSISERDLNTVKLGVLHALNAKGIVLDPDSRNTIIDVTVAALVEAEASSIELPEITSFVLDEAEEFLKILGPVENRVMEAKGAAIQIRMLKHLIRRIG